MASMSIIPDVAVIFTPSTFMAATGAAAEPKLIRAPGARMPAGAAAAVEPELLSLTAPVVLNP